MKRTHEEVDSVIGWEDLSSDPKHKAHACVKTKKGRIVPLCRSTGVYLSSNSARLQTPPSNACLKCKEMTGVK